MTEIWSHTSLFQNNINTPTNTQALDYKQKSINQNLAIQENPERFRWVLP